MNIYYDPLPPLAEARYRAAAFPVSVWVAGSWISCESFEFVPMFSPELPNLAEAHGIIKEALDKRSLNPVKALVTRADSLKLALKGPQGPQESQAIRAFAQQVRSHALAKAAFTTRPDGDLLIITRNDAEFGMVTGPDFSSFSQDDSHLPLWLKEATLRPSKPVKSRWERLMDDGEEI